MAAEEVAMAPAESCPDKVSEEAREAAVNAWAETRVLVRDVGAGGSNRMFKGHCVKINVDPIRNHWLEEQACGV